MSSKKIIVKSIILFSLSFLINPIWHLDQIKAATVEELNERIREQRKKIEELDREIEKQRQAVIEASGETQTIQQAVNVLEASRRKILADINETQAQIDNSELVIEKLGLEIDDKQQKINRNKEVLAKTIKEIEIAESNSLIEILLSTESISDFWNAIHEQETFNKKVKESIQTLYALNTELQDKKIENEEEAKELKQFKSELAGEHEAVAQTKKEKDVLLNAAQTKEKTYKQILDQKIAQKKHFEDALNQFESELSIILNKDAFPSAQSGVLSWPVDPPIVITQQFGGTQFAKTNPHIYGRPFHNGTDIDLETGDKVKAALSGTIQATGNTDAVPGCYSWGKWVLIKHNNGLTTLYAHLSAIMVNPGQVVSTGETIGLGGNTGYSTGSHLHFTLYASQGVSVQKFSDFKSTTGCGGATTPVAAPEAYLDPMQYLPSL